MAGLEQDGLQSDIRCLEALIRSLHGKGHGPQRIRHEAQLKGLDAKDLEARVAEYDFDAALERVHGHRFGEAAPASAKESAARLRYLLQRGFEHDRIQALLKRLRRGGEA